MKRKEDWKKLALYFARGIVRFQNNEWTRVFSDKAYLKAYRLIKNK